MGNHHINVFHSDEDEGWIADIPDLSGCSAFGETFERALQEVLAVKRLWIESANADGAEIPRPKFRPTDNQACT